VDLEHGCWGDNSQNPEGGNCLHGNNVLEERDAIGVSQWEVGVSQWEIGVSQWEW